MQYPADPRTGFRADINGLRAWAVVVVMMYHFGVPGFDGGFVGVDVFFVISGFLMTGIVVKDLEQMRFSLIGFYMARARRIVPALLGLCAALLGLGWFVLLPPDYKLLGNHVIASLGFFSNFKYWNESGYFDVASHEKWLLHTWSLSVEWQFYLILPLVLWVVWQLKPGRKAQLVVVVAGLVVSLIVSLLTTPTQPTTAFFLLPSRAWEMLGGGLVFLLANDTRKLGATHRQWLEASGLALILVSVFIFDARSIWPGWRATLPVVATMLILTANRVSPWTGHRFTQWLGDRSYSLYLWHWPVVVTLVYAELQHEFMAVAGGIIATLILGHLSFRWIEHPARRWLATFGTRIGAVVVTALLVLVMMPALVVRSQDGVAGRFSAAVELASAEADNVNPRRANCHSYKGHTSVSCVFGGPNWAVIAVGDSHVASTISAIAQVLPNAGAGAVQWSYSGCPFVPGMLQTPDKQARFGADYQCTEFIEWARSRLDDLPADIPIVIIGRYAQAAFGRDASRLVDQVPEVYFSKIYPVATPQFLAEFAQQVTQSACELAKRRRVYMVRPVPEMGFDVPKTLARRLAAGLTDDLSISIEEYRRRNAWLWAAQDMAHDQCGIRILDPLPYLCHDGRCAASKGGRPLYFDGDHLSEFGNKLLAPMFAEVFKAG